MFAAHLLNFTFDLFGELSRPFIVHANLASLEACGNPFPHASLGHLSFRCCRHSSARTLFQNSRFITGSSVSFAELLPFLNLASPLSLRKPPALSELNPFPDCP